MRKIALVLCVVLLLSIALTGCKPTPDLKVFNSWITINGFSPEMGQKTFLALLGSFSFLGKNLEPDGDFYEIPGGSSYSVGTDFWGMNSDLSTNDGITHSYNHFYVRKNLDNLTFPGEVRIGDTKEECLKKLDLEGKALDVKGIEIGNKTCEMTFVDSILVYKETFQWSRDDNKTSDVTRSVFLKFVGDSLYEVGVTVSEKYPE